MGLAALAVVAGLAVSWRLRAGWAGRVAESQLRAAAGRDGRWVVVVTGIDRRAHDAGRADAILVVSLGVAEHELGVLSVPRDTRVRVPGRGYNKVNAAYALAGSSGLVQAISELLGIGVDGYVGVDFEAFVRLVDALGGVELTIERPMRYVDRAQGLVIDLPPGRQRLDGRQALDYVRFRADGLGDVVYDASTGAYRGRVERQQRFVEALMASLSRPYTLWALPRVAREAYSLVETDLGMTLGVAAAAYLASRPDLTLKTAVLPGRPGVVAGASYWLPDAQQARRVAREVLGVAGGGPAVGGFSGAVAVLNANGVSGSAARVARRLQDHGVRVTAAANAETFGEARTWVWAVHRDALPLAAQVAELLGLDGQRVRLGEPGADAPQAAGADVVVRVGRDLASTAAGAARP